MYSNRAGNVGQRLDTSEPQNVPLARRWPTCPVVDPNGHWSADMEIIQMEEGGKQTSEKNWITNHGLGGTW